MPRSPRTRIHGPTCPLPSVHLLKPAPFLVLSSLSFPIFTKRVLSPRLTPPYGTRPHPSPVLGTPYAIGASSLRDPVPFLSLMCLLFLITPVIPLWAPRPEGTNQVNAICLLPRSTPLIYPGSRVAQGKMKKGEPAIWWQLGHSASQR